MSLHVPPPGWALAAGLLQRVVTRPRPPTRTTTLVSGAVTAASLGMLAGSLARFRRRGTTVDPVHPERAAHLVTTGPYAVSRNPMYAGLAGVLLAHALRLRSPAALLPVAAFVAVIDRTQVAAEEAALRARFGADYEAYCRRVPRWLGRR